MDSEKSEVKGGLKLEKLPIALCLGKTMASSMWQRCSRSQVLQSGCADEGWTRGQAQAQEPKSDPWVLMKPKYEDIPKKQQSMVSEVWEEGSMQGTGVRDKILVFKKSREADPPCGNLAC